MEIDHMKLGQLVEDYRDNHALQARLKMELRQSARPTRSHQRRRV